MKLHLMSDDMSYIVCDAQQGEGAVRIDKDGSAVHEVTAIAPTEEEVEFESVDGSSIDEGENLRLRVMGRFRVS